MKLFNKKNQLDEMQEATMRKIESQGFWVLWVGLLIVMVAQMVAGAPGRQMAGEWLVFMIGCAYTLVACVRNGLWDRHLTAKASTNALLSVIAAVAMTLLQGFTQGYWLFACVTGVLTGLLCFGALELFMSLTKKQREKLDKEE